MKKKRRKKSTPVKLLEYSLAYVLIFIARALPLIIARIISNVLGDLLYYLSKKRRTIAVENLRHAFRGNKTEGEIRAIARQSCRSFFFTFLEIIKLRHLFTKPDAMQRLRTTAENLDGLFSKAKKIHDESGGCIFVTPHMGNWEVLPHVSSFIGVPLAVVARPLDNEYLEKLIFRSRSSGSNVIIPKKNAMFVLQKTLYKGNSIGLLPDQSTMKGVPTDFFGRKATTTPVPAVLAVTYGRPIVVVACCRKEGAYRYEGFVSDPIMPGKFTSEKEEIIRLTEKMTREMETIIRRYPEQYLWIHNRWKTYKNKKELMAD
ncbi:MAG: lysophospholipid acyltransferase family protein [Nitrospirae bacterium]|nr:lysophospholipid acyltransferase family protein [Nitrospirota bacterium]